MAYHVIKDFGGLPGIDYASSNPYWIVAVYRLQEPVTYLRAKMGSYTTNQADGVKLRGAPLIITDDCLQLQVACSKSTYTSTLSASLIGSGLNYLSEIYPGDYVLAWMFTNQEDYSATLKSITESGKNFNGFNSGLKFFGRLQSLRKHLQQNPQGPKQVRFQLNAVGFQELDAQIFFDPHLVNKVDQMGFIFAQLGIGLTDLISDNQKGFAVDKAIDKFLTVMLGKGIPINENTKTQGKATQIATGLSPQYPYILPGILGLKFNIGHDQEKSFVTFSDLLEKRIGIQEYQNDASGVRGDGSVESDDQKASQFQPTITNPMLGDFIPAAPQFQNKSVWSVLQQYLNPAANEMYTCLRVNAKGLIMPTIVVRQLPFTSQAFEDREAPNSAAVDVTTPIKVTKFATLPRWVVDPVLVKAADIGRSDALRFNFVHVYGENGQPHGDKTAQLVRNPPLRDDLDIARSGLRPYMMTVPCHLSDVVTGGPGKWMALLSDIVMGQHMTLTGVLQTFGIQAPICVGDNLEWDGGLFHIEAITHSCQIQADGSKDFSTTLNLSHGVHAGEVDPLKNDLGMYAAVNLDDFTSLDPSNTADIISTDVERTGVRTHEPGSAMSEAKKRAREEALELERKKNASVLDGKPGKDQI